MPQLNINFAVYQRAAVATAASTATDPLNLAVLALGVAGEAGEVADLIKKHVGHGHPLDVPKVSKELGDVLWYVAVLAYTLELDLAQIAVENIEKLVHRYPAGFDPARSLNRDSA